MNSQLVATDTLSRAASALLAFRRAQAEGEELDRQFGAPSECFSGMAAANYRREAALLATFGFTPASYNELLRERVCGRWIYFFDMAAAEQEPPRPLRSSLWW